MSGPRDEMVPLRDAATVVALRRDPAGPRVLMGQRGAGAVFMPSKFVFPGGALDPEDLAFSPGMVIDPVCERRLAAHADPAIARGLAVAAIRELWEEAGLALARPDPAAPGLAPAAPPGLRSMLARGIRPDASGLRFIFRAITPPGRPRRFDARFFLVEAERLAGDPDDFSQAGSELAQLQWLPLAAARELELPFITEVVLAEIEAILDDGDRSRPVPFFHHDAAGSHITLV
jgi:8-oxo-dGTP pyrophosphatase MutT (NUDIX family)